MKYNDVQHLTISLSHWKKNEQPYEYGIPVADKLAICIARIVGAKIRAEKQVSNPWGASQLTDENQVLMDRVSDALDEATQALEALKAKLNQP